MNILFLTLSKITDIETRGIYTDLVRELESRGHRVYVVSPIEKRETELNTNIIKISENVTILKVRTGNITKTKSKIEKGISTIKIEKQFQKAILANFNSVRFDMILYSTPPITFSKVLKYFKKKHNSFTYLMLKDIFPQNAVDLEYMSKKSLIYKYFRKKEGNLYKNSDIIGCMSERNKEYILKHNDQIPTSKVEIFPNAILPLEFDQKSLAEKKEVLEKHGLDENKLTFLYGGNLGKPQAIDFLIEISKKFESLDFANLLIVGDGTEFNKLKKYFDEMLPANSKLIRKLPKKDYDQIVSVSDVGLLLLNSKFTIPNIPSRITSYMEYGIPVLAATDDSTDIGNIMQKGKFGMSCSSKKIDDFMLLVNNMKSEEIRSQMGANAQEYLVKHFNLEKNIDIILKHIEKDAVKDRI